MAPLREQLFQEILMARQRVYAVGRPTPVEPLHVPVEAEVFIKREDLSVVHSYKWRGAYNRMATLGPADSEHGVIAASAGNHAQGVALAARELGVPARIYMPESAPRMKQAAVKKHGQNLVEIVLHGDNYSEAADRALEDVRESGAAFIHPYDDLQTMGGQGTLADEAVMSGHGPFDVAYVQIGGGGLASAVACWLKAYSPGIHIVGVEGVDQACMAAAVAAGEPVELDYIDVFCDGTAVRKAGEKTYALCKDPYRRVHHGDERGSVRCDSADVGSAAVYPGAGRCDGACGADETAGPGEGPARPLLLMRQQPRLWTACVDWAARRDRRRASALFSL